MNYNLNQTEKKGVWTSVRELFMLMSGEKKTALLALFSTIANSVLNLSGPLLLAYAVDNYVTTGNLRGVFMCAGGLLLIYGTAFFTSYFQMTLTGGIGQRVVWNLRNKVFGKIQELPIKFFNQNKTGDLISRINNDTDLINQFFSQYITRFFDNTFSLVGIMITVLIVHIKLGSAMLAPAAVLLIITKLIGGWLKQRSSKSLQSIGGMSAEIQESLNNFKVIVAFNRRDYFKKKFDVANQNTFKANMSASVANSTVSPMYDLAANAAQLIVLAYGIHLIGIGEMSIGLLLAFFTYSDRFYYPLRQFATIWTSFQLSLAGWDRISEILKLESDLKVLSSADIDLNAKEYKTLLSFDAVSFTYADKSQSWIIQDTTFNLLAGKTYALVGPTGGGKTTTASLMARLFDPTKGVVSLFGKDIRTYTSEERTDAIGFILQEPFLFSGTVRENILYAHKDYIPKGPTDTAVFGSERQKIESELESFNSLMQPFENGFDTKITGSGEGMSLGQKQLIAFMRACIRKPKLLILDEATANIDTVTESLLEKVLNRLPKDTTKVIIAHRLNTIKNADEIFFVGGGSITPAGSFDHAVEMLLNNKRVS